MEASEKGTGGGELNWPKLYHAPENREIFTSLSQIMAGQKSGLQCGTVKSGHQEGSFH